MRFPPIRITTPRSALAAARPAIAPTAPATLPAAGRAALLAALVAALGVVIPAAGGCGASASELRAARTSGYEADFSLVYAETLEAVRKQYPQLIENAKAGIIKTAWHPVRLASSGDDPVIPPQSAATPFGQTSIRGKHFFVRFQVYVVGGNPWRVRVVGEASEWEAGGVPAPLKGASVPPWLQGRVDSLQVAIYRRLSKFAVPIENTERKDGEAVAQVEAEVDESPYRDLPPAATAAIVEVLRAAKSRDFARLAKAMHPEFTWSFGASPGADAALAMWQADSNALETLAGVIEAGCRHDPADQRVTCPPAYTEQPGYLGYRAGFAPGPDGAWKMVFFVEGD